MDDTTCDLITAYGGKLVDLLAPPEELAELKAYAGTLPSLQLSERSVCDLELMATGAFSPLNRFMGEDDYRSVLYEMRLADNRLFPLPVTMPVAPSSEIHYDRDLALRDDKNNLLAVLTIEEIFEWNLAEEARMICGSEDRAHPLVAEMQSWGKLNLSGRLRVLQAPPRHDFKELRLTPRQMRMRLSKLGRENVVSFQTRNPLHRVHEELTGRAIKQVNGILMLHPAVGMTNPGDTDHYTRIRTYQAFVRSHDRADQIVFGVTPLAMRMAGPREAVWHALIRRNYGANHLIVGRDHAGPGVDSKGTPFYGPYDAQELVHRYRHEIGVVALPFPELVYLPDEDRYEESSRIPAGARSLSISGTQVREQYLKKGIPLPEWFTRSETAEILAEAYPPKHRQGVCLWFTGLSGAGKSTTAEVLATRLRERGRTITMLDGDVVRTHLSKGLGFSKQDRDTNIRRIGIVAMEVARHGGIVIVAAVSPYRAARDEVRNLLGHDHFIEIYVDTPLEECERRDVKGMYAKARRGEIEGFTGVNDPYEAPLNPEITLDTLSHTPEDNAETILNRLISEGFVRR
jgi:sulfate adenylyltransferase